MVKCFYCQSDIIKNRKINNKYYCDNCYWNEKGSKAKIINKLGLIRNLALGLVRCDNLDAIDRTLGIIAKHSDELSSFVAKLDISDTFC